uniref:Uncharacterized protein n=1 Tax=Tetradesmus obliquus TaxID=3088 RepID=A0A383VNU8_TETOB|eukprot:jgi/Sobl393_1/465/SZX67205.1
MDDCDDDALDDSSELLSDALDSDCADDSEANMLLSQLQEAECCSPASSLVICLRNRQRDGAAVASSGDDEEDADYLQQQQQQQQQQQGAGLHRLRHRVAGAAAAAVSCHCSTAAAKGAAPRTRKAAAVKATAAQPAAKPACNRAKRVPVDRGSDDPDAAAALRIAAFTDADAWDLVDNAPLAANNTDGQYQQAARIFKAHSLVCKSYVTLQCHAFRLRPG